MDPKMVLISALIGLILLVVSCLMVKLMWRLATGSYPPSKHVVKFDDEQLRMLLQLPKMCKST